MGSPDKDRLPMLWPGLLGSGLARAQQPWQPHAQPGSARLHMWCPMFSGPGTAAQSVGRQNNGWPAGHSCGKGNTPLARVARQRAGMRGPGHAYQTVARLARPWPSQPSCNQACKQAQPQPDQPGQSPASLYTAWAAWQHTHTAYPQPCQPDPS